MEYKRFDDTVLIRMDRGEEILLQLERVASAENIHLAHISALGAVNDFTVGVFHTDTKEYHSNHFTGSYEIVSLTGTITTKHGAYYSHLHMSAGDGNGNVVGGHLNSALVSATCEMVVTIVDGTVERRFNEDVGLNLFAFAE